MKKKIEKEIEKKLSSSLPSRKFLNYRKILFLQKVMVVFLPAPIYKRLYVRDDIQIDRYRYEIFLREKGADSSGRILQDRELIDHTFER